MVQISNNVLAILLLIAIVISGIGFVNLLAIPGVRITGAASTQSGYTNLSVNTVFSIVMLRNTTDFGTGDVNSGIFYNITTNKTNEHATGGVAFRNGSEGNETASDYGTGTHVYPFVIENDGNDNVTCVRVQSATDASTFLGGAGNSPGPAAFWVTEKDNETANGPSCEGNKASTWLPVNSTGYAYVCQQLRLDMLRDSIRLHWRLDLPSDAAQGVRSNTITITALTSC